jgi:ubiquitin-like 1-activating enzyme E1 B
MGSVRSAVLGISKDATEEEQKAICRRAFEKVFKEDVERLLRMDDMWRRRRRPVPLGYDEASQEEAGSTTNGNGDLAILRDQKVLSLKETVDLFNESLLALAHRSQANAGDAISFDKDDLDTLNFVTATSNLRSRIYHIAPQTRFQVKEMAGNIIPAIASTNAIIAGAQVIQLLQALRHAWKDTKFVSLNKMNSTRLLTSFACGKPNIECGVCQEDYVRAKINVESTTLGQFKQSVLRQREEGGLGYTVEGLEIFESSRLLADEDFDDNLQKTLHAMGIKEGMTITCVDEDGIRASVNVVIAAAADSQEMSIVIDFGAAEKLPQLRQKVKVEKPKEDSDDDDVVELSEKPTVTQTTKRKRNVQEEEVGEVASSTKKKKTAPQSGAHEEEAIELD